MIFFLCPVTIIVQNSKTDLLGENNLILAGKLYTVTDFSSLAGLLNI